MNNTANPNPFSTRTLLALVLFGSIVFVSLLWMLGSVFGGGSTNNGGGHAGGKGLNGYAAFATLLEKQGYAVRKSRSKNAFNDPGVLILTPPHYAKAEEIGKIIAEHYRTGPTILILPKWEAAVVPKSDPSNSGGKKGWVRLYESAPPVWSDSVPGLGTLDVRIEWLKGTAAQWKGLGLSGSFPDAKAIQTISSGLIEASVRDGNGQTLAGYLTDWASPEAVNTSDVNNRSDDQAKGSGSNSSFKMLSTEDQPQEGVTQEGVRQDEVIQEGVDQEYPDQGYNDRVESADSSNENNAESASAENGSAMDAKAEQESTGYPVLIVAEPDLFNNYGMANMERARLALSLIDDVSEGEKLPIIMDLTLNGLGQSSNLLTLAFTPPFLAATLCLLLAALTVGWRAFLRFGPPRQLGREIAFGKRALIANAAGIINRSGRLHLAAAPFADSARDRLARSLALPRQKDAAATEAAIDRAIASRTGQNSSFSTLAARLRAASRPSDIVKAAQDIHALERTLKR